MEKFEQLIEFIINDEEEKAKELFHDVVVEKSRDIYEQLMAEDEAKAEADAKEVAESDEKVESTEDKEVKESSEEVTDEAIETEEEVGGDQADDLISDVEADEEGISEEDGDEGEADAEELEDRVVDLEDKMDELMGEFEAIMGEKDEEAPAEEGDMEMEMPEEGVAPTEEPVAEAETSEEKVEETKEETKEEKVEEGVAMKAVKADNKGGDDNAKSPVPADSGKKGAEAKPGISGGEEKGKPAPKAGDMGGTTEPDMKKV